MCVCTVHGLQTIVEALGEVLAAGEEWSGQEGAYPSSSLRDAVEEAGAVQELEALMLHPSQDIAQLATHLVDRYFPQQQEEEEQQGAGHGDQTVFSFGVPGLAGHPGFSFTQLSSAQFS